MIRLGLLIPRTPIATARPPPVCWWAATKRLLWTTSSTEWGLAPPLLADEGVVVAIGGKSRVGANCCRSGGGAAGRGGFGEAELFGLSGAESVAGDEAENRVDENEVVTGADVRAAIELMTPRESCACELERVPARAFATARPSARVPSCGPSPVSSS